MLGRHCYHHAWHAELWHKRLPELREMNPDRLTLPANDEFVTFMDAMREPEAPEHTIEKLVGVYRVLIPRKIAAYTYHLNDTSTITDAPTIRSLKFALQDEFEDWRDGEMLIQSLHRDAREGRAGQRRTRPELEKLMLAAGGIAGPGSLGRRPSRSEAARSQREEDAPAEPSWPVTSASSATKIEDRVFDPRGAGDRASATPAPAKMAADRPDAAERARVADARHLRR